jgi:hypothetical protein
MKQRFSSLSRIGLALVLLGLPTVLPAQDATPFTLSQDVLPDEAVDQHVLGFVDVDYLKFEDAVNADKAGPDRVPFRVAEPVAVRYTLDQHGTREALPNGGSLWRLRVTSPGALFVSFQLSDFALPAGAELRFHSVDRAFETGPYTARNNNADRVFGSPAIPGDSAVIELYTPAVVPFDPSFVVSSVSHGYRDFNGFANVPFRSGLALLPESIRNASEKASMACEVDVNCSAGSGWQADKRAVARTYDGRYLCTGALVNNARQDCKPYFLTAAHCVSRAQAASAMTFYWNYEKSGCNSGTAPTNQTSSGSTLRATGSSSDFTLLELNAAPSSAYNVYFAGFSRSTSAPSSGVAIHHPAGDVKKISFENDPLQDGGNFTGGWGGTHWRVVGWDTGTTEGGSSGCPIFNSSHQIVGQLHGGTAGCSGGWDEFGKVSSSWGAGLSSWLDPDNTGLTSLGGKESSTCSGGGGTCAPAGTACTSNAQCCSGSCPKKTKRCS